MKKSAQKEIYEMLLHFRRKYPLTVVWRLKKHAKIASLHLNPDEKILYAFAGQKNDSPFEIFNTYIVVLTSKRILLATKRVIFGYFLVSITPDMFNDLTVNMGLIWGKIHIDTIKEVVHLSNLQREALPEIETVITEYMMEEKKKYATPLTQEN